jgi:MerR family transcriptional regulator/heat shock protein HspR
MNIDKNKPIYPISVAAKILGIHPQTLRIYEEEGLVSPFRQGAKRYYSQNNIEWINCLRQLIHEEGISIPGIKHLLELTPCWEIKKCAPERRDNCSAYIDNVLPCWERVSSVCAKEMNKCQECEVYIKAMKSAISQIDDCQKKRDNIKILKVKREQLSGICSGNDLSIVSR